MSGGRSTVARKSGKENRQAGDITSVSEEGNSFSNTFYVECKHLRSIGFDGLVKGGGALKAIWDDTVEKAKHYRRIPLLIAQQNRWPIIVCTNTEGTEALGMFKAVIIVPRLNIYISILEEVLGDCRPNAWARGWERLDNSTHYQRNDVVRPRVRREQS